VVFGVAGVAGNPICSLILANAAVDPGSDYDERPRPVDCWTGIGDLTQTRVLLVTEAAGSRIAFWLGVLIVGIGYARCRSVVAPSCRTLTLGFLDVLAKYRMCAFGRRTQAGHFDAAEFHVLNGEGDLISLPSDSDAAMSSLIPPGALDARSPDISAARGDGNTTITAADHHDHVSVP